MNKNKTPFFKNHIKKEHSENKKRGKVLEN